MKPNSIIMNDSTIKSNCDTSPLMPLNVVGAEVRAHARIPKSLASLANKAAHAAGLDYAAETKLRLLDEIGGLLLAGESIAEIENYLTKGKK